MKSQFGCVQFDFRWKVDTFHGEISYLGNICATMSKTVKTGKGRKMRGSEREVEERKREVEGEQPGPR